MPNLETTDRVRNIVSTVFNVPLSEVTEESSPATVEAWDSMGQLMLILELEQEFEISISPEVGEKMTSVTAVADAIDGI